MPASIATTLEAIDPGKLKLDPLNPRQQVEDHEIEDLAESIRMSGLLQNLCGLKRGRAKYPTIVAGGRRMRAIQLLVSRGDWDRGDVPVLVTRDEATAAGWAGAENEAREALSPADEVTHYRRMADGGFPVSTIAKAYAVTERHVARRMKLARLPDPVIEALRGREITLDVAAAFTVSENADAILSVLDQTRGKDVTAHAVRRALTEGSVPASDRRAVFVGLDAYRAAGGAVTDDLFTEDAILHDADLLDRLFAETLEDTALAIEAKEGWQKVNTVPDHYLPYGFQGKLRHIAPEPVELPEDDAAELEELSAVDRDLTPHDHARLCELLDRERGSFSDARRAEAQIWIYVDNRGQLRRDEAYTSAKPKPAKSGSPDAGQADEPATLSQALIDDLRRIRTLALQQALVEQTLHGDSIVIDLLAYELQHDITSWHRVLHVSTTEPMNMPDKAEAITANDVLTETRIAGGNEPGAKQFDAWRKTHGDGVLDADVALTLCRTAEMQPTEFARHIWTLTGAHMRKVWRPTAVNFFARCSVPWLDQLHDQLFGTDGYDGASFWSDKKKSEKAELLEKLFDTTPENITALKLDDATVATLNNWIPEDIA